MGTNIRKVPNEIGNFLSGIKSTFHEFTAPSKAELLYTSETLDSKIEEKSMLQKSITELRWKIVTAKTEKQRNFLENQIKNLEETYMLYKKYKKEKYTERANASIKSLFKKINIEMSNNKTIDDENQSIRNIIEAQNKSQSQKAKSRTEKHKKGKTVVKKNITYPENDKVGNYVSFLEKHELSTQIEKVGIDLIQKKLSLTMMDEKNKVKILSNLKTFIVFMADMENNGTNVKNKNSSARGYFQILHNNEGYTYEVMIHGVYHAIGKKKWEDLKTSKNSQYNKVTISKFNKRYNSSTMEETIHTAKKYFGSNQPKWLRDITLQKNGPTKGFDISKYTAEQQTILMLISIFYSKRKIPIIQHEKIIGYNTIRTHLIHMLSQGNTFSMRRIYESVWHTVSDKNTRFTNKATELRTDKFIMKWGQKLIH